jgi:ABC-2 type transport system permease protein
MTEKTQRLQVASREAVGLVAGRELRVRIRSKAYLITLVILGIAAVALPVILYFVNTTPSATKIAVPRQDTALSSTLTTTAAQLGQKIEIVTVTDHAAGVAEVRSGSVSALVEPGTPGEPGLRTTVDKSLDGSLGQLFTVAADPKASAALTAAPPQVATLTRSDPQQGQRITIAIIAGLLMYMSLMLVGQFVAQGVVEEKSSRVVELLLATIRPWQLLAGKVLGTGLLGFIQIAVPAVLGVATGLITGKLNLSLSSSLGTVGWALLWYVVGFAMYAMVFAALGATVSRQEDVQGLTFPAVAPLILAWVIGISVVPTNPGNALVTWLSMVPPCAPVLMPMRIAMGAAPVWQILVSLVLSIAFAFVLLRFAGRVYRNSVLRSGSRVPLREALKAA